AEVWSHAEGDLRPTNTAKEGQDRFSKFTRHVEAIGLTRKFRDPLSAKLLVSFYKLNSELTYMKLLQEMNELATRKIIKKHDKRTHLIAKTQFPQLVTFDTMSLTRALIFTVYTELVGVVPQINDYTCPMCLNIAWRPLRLECSHVFCSRCVVKASRCRMFNCPVCRSKDAVYKAGISNVDQALLNFLKLYFPKEVKERQRDIQQEIAEEETGAIVAAHLRHLGDMLRIVIGSCLVRRSASAGAGQLARHAPVLASKTMSLRTLSTSHVCEGRPRQYADHSRYPRPRSARPDRPEKIATDALMSELKKTPKTGAEMIESIRVTDDEVTKIFESIMSVGQRQLLDEQSLRHKTRTEFLEMRHQAKERQSGGETGEGSATKSTKMPAQEPEGDSAPDLPAVVSVSDTVLDQMAYVDTRHIREIEEAKRAVIASVDLALVDRLQERVHAAVLTAETKGDNDSTGTRPTEIAVSEQHSSHEGVSSVNLSADLTLAEFNHVIYANTLGGRAQEAMRAYELLRESGIKPDQATFANLTMALAKSGDLKAAVSMFKALETEGLEPNVYSYGTLIRAYMEFGRVDDSFRVYEMMKAREVWPNLPVYNSLIVASLKVGDLKRAWGVFEHLRYTIAKPDEISFSIMIHACAKNGQVEKAMNLLDEMVSNRLTLSDVTFNSLIHACAVRPDYFDEGFRLLQLMESHGFQPDFFTYNTLLYACARKKNLGLARNIFREMLNRSMKEGHRDLVKIDQVTISNMMWAYSSYLSPVKTCSWKIAKRFESLALDTLAAVKGEESGSDSSKPKDSFSKHEWAQHDIVAATKFTDMQSSVARATKELVDGSSGNTLDDASSRQVQDLVSMLMPAE
ncbi:hypothetical protein GGI20_006006, partial [Coemansia sp. BCRC 34301]